MKKKGLLLKMITVAAMTLSVAGFAGCGNTDDSKKEYLDDIKVKDYVKLGEYKGLEVTLAEPQVSEAEIDAYIKKFLSRDATNVVKEGDTVEVGDIVNIDYVGTLDGVAFDGGTAAGQDLTIGTGQFIDGFEEGLVGAKIGDIIDLDLTFSEDYLSEEMAGQSVVFNVTINSIMIQQLPELTDEYVQGLGIECNTVDEYKQYINDMLLEEAQNYYDMNIESSLMISAMDNSEFIKDPPQAMLDRYVDALTSTFSYRASSYGVTLEEFMQLYYQMDVEAYQEKFKSEALKAAQQIIVLKAIADAEDLNVTDEELQAEIEQMAVDAGYETVDQFKEVVKENEYKEFMMREKVGDMLKENAVISAE